MVSISEIRNRYGTKYYDFVGLSTDEKPTKQGKYKSGLKNGSSFFEMNTEKVFMYDYENEIWVEL